jgi:hypothetical protein
MVERHRLDVELRGQPAHGPGLETEIRDAGLGHVEDPVGVERFVSFFRGHLDNLTL